MQKIANLKEQNAWCYMQNSNRELVIVNVRTISCFLSTLGRGGRKGLPPSEIYGAILFDQIFTLEPIHSHIVNWFVVYVHGHVELLHLFRGQVIRKRF